MTRAPRQSRPRGLNLLEMIFAATLFATVAVALLGVWSMHARAVAHSRTTLLATHLAEVKLEEAKSKGWQVESWASNPTTAYRVETYVNGQQILEEFDWEVKVTHRQTLEGGQFKLIQVKVTWEEQKEQRIQREVNLDTIITWQT